jgi:hypothetical protein
MILVETVRVQFIYWRWCEGGETLELVQGLDVAEGRGGLVLQNLVLEGLHGGEIFYTTCYFIVLCELSVQGGIEIIRTICCRVLIIH